MLDEQKIIETEFSIDIRSGWRRPIDVQILLIGLAALAAVWFFWPTSLKILGLAGPPVACFGLIAMAVSAARAVLETRLYISDIGLNGEIRALRFLKIRSWHTPRRQARQAFVRADFSTKKPTRSLRLLLADGSTVELLHGLEEAAAKRLEAKTDQILGLQNEAVVGEDKPRRAWEEGIFAYPEPMEKDALLPASAIFDLDKQAHDHLLIREKIFTPKRLAALAELGLLLAVSIFLNGVNPLFWLLTAWPILLAMKKIGLPRRLDLAAGRVGEWELGFRPSELISALVAPDETRGFEVVNYQVLIVSETGERRPVWRKLPLEEAYFLERQIKIWYKMSDEPALGLIQKAISKA